MEEGSMLCLRMILRWRPLVWKSYVTKMSLDAMLAIVPSVVALRICLPVRLARLLTPWLALNRAYPAGFPS